MARPAPQKSTWCEASGSRDSPTRVNRMASTISAIGTLMKKTARHENVWASHPPAAGPIAAVIDEETGPGPDGPAACLAVEVGGENCQASGRRKGAADALDATRKNQRVGIRSKRAEDRGECEERDAEPVDEPSPEDVAERAAEQQQGREKKRIGLDHPLHLLGGRTPNCAREPAARR